VIGRASANEHRPFEDLAGKANNHRDWLVGDAAQFRKMLRAVREQ
jgi:hypothetical protein